MNMPNIEHQTPEGNRPADRAVRLANLAALPSQINNEHDQVERSLRASVEHAIRCGELLLQAKRGIDHGNWTEWLQQNINFSDRLAQAYMRLARMPAEKRNAVADLPLREALSAIRSRQKLLSDAEKTAPSEPKQKPATPAKFIDAGWDEDEEGDIESEIEPDNRRLAFLIRADQAKQFSVYSGPIDKEIVEAARAAALAWNDLARKLEGEIPNEDDGLDIPDYLKRGVS